MYIFGFILSNTVSTSQFVVKVYSGSGPTKKNIIVVLKYLEVFIDDFQILRDKLIFDQFGG